jgi:hypothetical protein
MVQSILQRRFATKLKDSHRKPQLEDPRKHPSAMSTKTVAVVLLHKDVSRSVSMDNSNEQNESARVSELISLLLLKSLDDVKYNVNIHIYTFLKYLKTKQFFFI